MSTDLTVLKSVAVSATRLMMLEYDKQTQDLGLFAQTVNRPTRQRTLHIEWWDAFPMIREWIGDRQPFTGFKAGIDVDIKRYELTFKLDLRELDLDGDRSLVQGVQDIAPKFIKGFDNGRFLYAYAPIRTNATTTYDGQNIFDTDHVHVDGATFSNVIDLSDESHSRASSGAPTPAEAQTELQLAVQRLTQNHLRNVSLVKMTRPPLTVIVNSFNVWKGYNDLLTLPLINNTTNTWAGGFELFQDFSPVSGNEKKVVVILSEPGGPRPAIFVPARNPDPIKFDAAKVFTADEAWYGSDADFGFAAGLPHPAVLIQE